MSDMKQISRQELTEKLLVLFQKLGVSKEDAIMVADTLITADQWGVSSHGVMRVERYVRHYVRCGTDPRH